MTRPGTIFCPRCVCDTIPNPGGWCSWCDTRLFWPPRNCGARVTKSRTTCDRAARHARETVNNLHHFSPTPTGQPSYAGVA